MGSRCNKLHRLDFTFTGSETMTQFEQEMNRVQFSRERHGGLYDRGQADSWYDRPASPHWYPDGSYNGDAVVDLTDAEKLEYMRGFLNNEKSGGKKKWN